jgi:hypothetical protein
LVSHSTFVQTVVDTSSAASLICLLLLVAILEILQTMVQCSVGMSAL